ncbi:MAG: DUF3024 domain-containing protein [Trichloromonadaceae bacterium]
MAIPELVKKSAERLLDKYCVEKIPPCARDQVRLSYRVADDAVTLFEERISYADPTKWLAMGIAQFRFNAELKQWTLHSSDRSNRWHLYLNAGPSLDFGKLLRVLDDDPLRMFWG